MRRQRCVLLRRAIRAAPEPTMICLVLIGILVHVLLLSSVFDIYFVSPLQHGMTPHKSEGVPPANRLVLFVADGLRADSLYSTKMNYEAPYLSSRKSKAGSWGVSHTQVPTESRPGHIAMLAGFNEDPSAIMKGWKSNPVDFDSVINQSTHAWCWGSPDIMDIFAKDKRNNIHLYSYDAYMQDFSGKELPTILDNWVFNHVEEFFEIQKKGGCTDFCEDGNINFLHLLGLDTTGHAFKPNSKELVRNIKVVDEIVRKTERLFERSFRDKKTAYIFTADHGMTDWGSHGDGSLHETNVPFIAWGAGIMKNATRQDIVQTDIAAFIAALIGIHYPVNSLGTVPLRYLNVTDMQKAQAIYTNSRQLSEQYITKHKTLEANIWVFQPFSELTEKMLSQKLAIVKALIEKNEYKRAINSSYDLINLCKVGLKYYDNYYQNILLFFVTTGFIGWTVFLCVSITELNTPIFYHATLITHRRPHCSTMIIRLLLYISLIVIVSVLLAQKLPFKYYIYCTFPIFTWLAVSKNNLNTYMTWNVLKSFPCDDFSCMIAAYVAGLELLMFSFFEGYNLTLVFIYLAFHCMLCYPGNLLIQTWILRQVLLALGPLVFSLQTTFSYVVHAICYVLWMYHQYKLIKKPSTVPDKPIFWFQFALLTIAFTNSLWVNISLEHGKGLPYFNQLVSWSLLVVTLFCPLFVSNHRTNRILSIVMALMIPYTLMAVGYEHLYMYFFVQHMLNWEAVELDVGLFYRRFSRTPLHVLNAQTPFTDQQTWRRCFYLLACIMLSYFGVGNTASINSFDPMWARCFITVFSPFTMTSIILVKLMIPFMIVMCVFQGVMVATKAQTQNTFLILFFFLDFMVIQLLYFVKNEGSWLEIGISLSRFVVANITTIVLLILYEITYFLMKVKINLPFLKRTTPARRPRFP